MTVAPWLDAREDYPKGDMLWLCPEHSKKTVYVDLPTSTPPDDAVPIPFRVLDESYLRNAVDVVALFNEVALDVARRFFGPLLEDPRISGAFPIAGSTEKGREASIMAGRVVFTGDAPDWRYAVVNGLGHVRVGVELDLTKPATKAVFDAVTLYRRRTRRSCRKAT